MRLFKAKLKNQEFLMEVEPGVLISGELEDYMVYWCFACEHEKDPAFQFSRVLICPGNTVIDVGANIGLWVLGAARRVGIGGDVHAFEPIPGNFVRLTNNLARNGYDWVHCQPIALSDKCGRSVMYATSNGNSGGASLAQREGVDIPVEVPMTTLDKYCEEQGIRHVDFLKVDVEGAELFVFRGASKLLSSQDAPVIIFEVDEAHATSFASSSVLVKKFLHQFGYDFFRYNWRNLEKISLQQLHKHEDLIAFKPSHFSKHSVLFSYE